MCHTSQLRRLTRLVMQIKNYSSGAKQREELRRAATGVCLDLGELSASRTTTAEF